MGDPLFWVLLARTLATDGRKIAEVSSQVADAMKKIIDLGKAIFDLQGSVGELSSKARKERMERLIELQVAAQEAVSLRSAKLTDAYAEYAAAFLAAREADARLEPDIQEVKKLLLRKRTEAGAAGSHLTDSDRALEDELVRHLQIASRLKVQLEQTHAQLMEVRSTADEQDKLLEVMGMKIEVLKQLLGFPST